MSDARWEHFPHQADIGVRGIGPTLASAFEQAAVAMTAVICDVDAVAAKTRVEIDCAAPDTGLLLVEWLNALILEMAAEGLLFGRVFVSGSILQLCPRENICHFKLFFSWRLFTAPCRGVKLWGKSSDS